MTKRTIFILLALCSGLWAAVGQNDYSEIMAITILGYVIVLVALTFIYLFLMSMSKILERFSQYRANTRKQKEVAKSSTATLDKSVASMEAVSAVMMALHLAAIHKEEEEKAILTISKIVRPYSPWSSKIYNMRTNPWITHR